MCLAIPYGRNSPSGGTRLRRWLHCRPANSLRLTGAFALATGPLLLAAAGLLALVSITLLAGAARTAEPVPAHA
jgi:hypothetical protein